MVPWTRPRAVRGRRLIVGDAEIGTPTVGHFSAGDFMHPLPGVSMRVVQEQDMEDLHGGRSNGMVPYRSTRPCRSNVADGTRSK